MFLDILGTNEYMLFSQLDLYLLHIYMYILRICTVRLILITHTHIYNIMKIKQKEKKSSFGNDPRYKCGLIP